MPVLLFASHPSAAGGAGGFVPVETQLPILLKAVTYDREIGKRASAEFLLLAVYTPGVAESERAAKALRSLFEEFAGKTIFERPLKGRVVAWPGPDSLVALVAVATPAAIYLAEGCDAHLAFVLGLADERRILTFGGTPELVEKGASIGVGERDGRPEIVVNLASARREGGQLSADLLKLCRVIR